MALLRHLVLLKRTLPSLLAILVVTALYIYTTGRFGSSHDQSGGVELEGVSLSSKARAAAKAACSVPQGAGRILVTGAAGFIGLHSCIGLRKEGYWVVGLDNFNAYYPVSLKLAREEVLRRYGIPVMRADLNNEPLVADLFASRMCYT
jgi:UDP-glucuronate 4-epimerase